MRCARTSSRTRSPPGLNGPLASPTRTACSFAIRRSGLKRRSTTSQDGSGLDPERCRNSLQAVLDAGNRARLERFRFDRNRSSIVSLAAADPRVRACAGAPDGRRAAVAAEARVRPNGTRCRIGRTGFRLPPAPVLRLGQRGARLHSARGAANPVDGGTVLRGSRRRARDHVSPRLLPRGRP